jgi:hypothetical protein
MANAKAQAAETTAKDTKAEVVDAAPIKEHKAEGSLVAVNVMELSNNIHRSDETSQWIPEKIQGLKETYLVDGFQSTFEVCQDKLGRVSLAGGGHHRKKALQELVEAGEAEKVRGLFKDAEGNWCIKVVKKNYTKDEMLRNYVIENADAWAKDTDQNVYMMTVQVKSFLETLLGKATDAADFVTMVNSPNPLKMDDRSFTRAKNSGVSASSIRQFLGEHTWSLAPIQMACQLISEPGDAGVALREIAKKLPSVAMAYKVRNMMTEVEKDEDSGEEVKVRSSKADIVAAEKIIETQGYNYHDLRDIDAFKKEQEDAGTELSPLEAIREFTSMKKDELKADKDAKKTKTEPVSKTKGEEAEQFVEAMKHALMSARLGKTKVSKAQYVQAESLFKDLATELKEMRARFGGNGKKKNK